MIKLMKCGCAANAKLTRSGMNPVDSCAIHNCTEVVTSPDLTGRKARCTCCAYGGKEVSSNMNLAFFQYHPNKPFDSYYCGCYGWD